MTTYLLVSVADKAPIIDQLWKARKAGGCPDTGLLLHALYAYDPAENAAATEDALKLVAAVAENEGPVALSRLCLFQWLFVNQRTLGLPPDRFLRVMTRLRELDVITLETLNELKASPS